jgi:hypothetical protein
MTKSEKFLSLSEANFDPITGTTNKVSNETLEKYGLGFSNGGSWVRKSSSLAKKFIVKLFKEEKGNRITAIQLMGFNKAPKFSQYIPKIVKDSLKGKQCCFCGTSSGDMEIDHKDGRKENITDVGKLSANDFQPSCKHCNDVKRQRCFECKETGIRFDAKEKGYSVSVVEGNLLYEGSCVGCYYYDPISFNNKFYKKENKDAVSE